VKDTKEFSPKQAQNSFVVAYGDLKDGYKLVGPFVCREDAESYKKAEDLPWQVQIIEVDQPDAET
jgi:hypothetical protein